MKDGQDYVVVFAVGSSTITSRVISAPNVAIAITRAVLSLVPDEEHPLRTGVILSVKAFRCVQVAEDVDYGF